MNKDEFIRMQQAATNRVREMQKKAMQNNEKSDKNTNIDKNIENNKKTNKSTWSDGSSITYIDNTINTKYPVMPDFVTPISETKYKKDTTKSNKSINNSNNTKYISTSSSSYGSVFDSPITLNSNNTSLSTKKEQAVCCNCPANKGLFNNLSGQNDRLLLLGIIILLMGDNVDELLILALIYIML